MEKLTSKNITIELTDISKKFVQEWIFRAISASINSQHNYAVIGPNGSGKSTLLQCISGLVPLTTGNIEFVIDNQKISTEDIFRHISIVSPATELIEEFTLAELFDFHTRFKQIRFVTAKEFTEAIFLEKHLHKQIKNFSSGMKQRLKLGLAFFSQSEILLFDEPTTNLDSFGCQWYTENCELIANNRLILVASNQKHEYEFCDKFINIVDFK